MLTPSIPVTNTTPPLRSKPTATLKGLACFTSPMEDPMITRHEDSDDEEEREDFELKPTDNLLVVAKLVREEEATLEVYVYNEERDDWYLHHDYILDAPPLCLATFSYDPGANDRKGNLLGVGTMDSVVNIWDLVGLIWWLVGGRWDGDGGGLRIS